MNKYRNKPTQVDGFRFASKKEAARYSELKLLKMAGEIEALEIQPRFDVVINGQKVCFYLADFAYRRDGVRIVEDVKSPTTRKQPVYRLKKKLVHALHGVDVVEV